MKLAREITALYHNSEETEKSENNFITVFRKGEIPENMKAVNILPNEGIIEEIVKAKLSSSKSEARRLIQQGGVKVNGEKISNFNDVILKGGDVIQVGKGKFVKIVI